MKRFFPLYMLLLLSFSALQGKKKQIDVTSGYSKIQEIMHDQNLGIAGRNAASCKIAQTANLVADLHIKDMAEFFECQTKMGQAFLEEMLAQPLSPADKTYTLHHRQEVIKTLVNNQELKAKVEKIVRLAAEYEQIAALLLSADFMAAYCPQVADIRMLRQVKPYSAAWDEIFQTYTVPSAARNAIPAAILGGYGYLVYKLIDEYKKASDSKKNMIKKGFYAACKSIYTGFEQYPKYEWDEKAGEFIVTSYTQGDKLPIGVRLAPIVVSSIVTGVIGLSAYKLYSTYASALTKRNAIYGFNRLVALAQEIEKLSKDGLWSQFKLSKVQDETAKKCIHEFSKSRYAGKNTKLFFHSKVHTFTYDFFAYDFAQHLAELFAPIAELDAYVAIANKMGTKTEKNPWCFATFVHQEKPVIRAVTFWNVLVKNAIPNTMLEDRNVLLTGPNAGGKSTGIRSILQNIVLAQTFGVAAASSFEFTPFDYIHSYINISDDLINGLSLFASEVKRAQEILGYVKALQPGQKFYFALDELFTGTNAVEGEACACEYITQLAAYTNIQFVYATHFDKLKELGQELSTCTNYKVDAPEQLPNGTLKYPFTISPGASNVNVALQMATNAGLFVK